MYNNMDEQISIQLKQHDKLDAVRRVAKPKQWAQPQRITNDHEGTDTDSIRMISNHLRCTFDIKWWYEVQAALSNICSLGTNTQAGMKPNWVNLHLPARRGTQCRPHGTQR